MGPELTHTGKETTGALITSFEKLLELQYPQALRGLWKSSNLIGGIGVKASSALIDHVAATDLHGPYTKEQVQDILDNSLRGKPVWGADQRTARKAFERGEFLPSLILLRDMYNLDTEVLAAEAKSRLVSKRGIQTTYPFIQSLLYGKPGYKDPDLLRRINMLEMWFALNLRGDIAVDLLEPTLDNGGVIDDIHQLIEETRGHETSRVLTLELVEFLPKLAEGNIETIARLKRLLENNTKGGNSTEVRFALDDLGSGDSVKTLIQLVRHDISLHELKISGAGTHALAGDPHSAVQIALKLEEAGIDAGKKAYNKLLKLSRNGQRRKNGALSNSSHKTGVTEIAAEMFSEILTIAKKNLSVSRLVLEGDFKHPIWEELVGSIRAGVAEALRLSGSHGIDGELNSIAIAGPIEKVVPARVADSSAVWLHKPHPRFSLEEKGKGKKKKPKRS